MEKCLKWESFFSNWLFFPWCTMISIKQPITKETFLFETFFHISLLWSFSFCLFLNTTTLFIGLMVQIGLYFKVSSKHTRNNCVLRLIWKWQYICSIIYNIIGNSNLYQYNDGHYPLVLLVLHSKQKRFWNRIPSSVFVLNINSFTDTTCLKNGKL